MYFLAQIIHDSQFSYCKGVGWIFIRQGQILFWMTGRTLEFGDLTNQNKAISRVKKACLLVKTSSDTLS